MTARARIIAPDWPGLMEARTAAAYCDMSEPEFRKAVGLGSLPPPVRVGKSLRWRKRDIDKTLAILSGEELDDWRKDSVFYGKAR